MTRTISQDTLWSSRVAETYKTAMRHLGRQRPTQIRGEESRLPCEVEEGNVEYKLQLLDPAPDRLRQLVTQLHWRLNEGKGTAFYQVGVKDNGETVGISSSKLEQSLRTLCRMCELVRAEVELVSVREGLKANQFVATMKAMRIPQQEAEKKHLRVSVIGDASSGKSTLIGVLTRGCPDDGNGLARMQVVRHRHEIENGRTSSISEHTIGISQDGDFCNVEVMDPSEMLDAQAEFKRLLTFCDLAGHKKYLRITASGLASQFPDYALLVVDSSAGVQAMTREHLKMAVALGVKVFVVLTKTDVVTQERILRSMQEVEELLQCCCPSKRCTTASTMASTFHDDHVIPVFEVSNVSMQGLELLQNYLRWLTPTRAWTCQDSLAEFQINKAYDFEDQGTVVTGLMQSGMLSVGEDLLLGPDGKGNFYEIQVESIEVQRKSSRSLAAGETGAVLLSFASSSGKVLHACSIRKGMMLLHPSLRPKATLQFDAEVKFLADTPRRIRENYQAVIHAGPIRQMARLVHIEDAGISTNTATTTTSQSSVASSTATTLCRFQFMYWPEYIRPDLPLLLREGNAQAAGRVLRAVPFKKEQPTSVRTC